MKAQLVLFAGTIAGLTLAATPVLSQERPDAPGTRPPATTPGLERAGANDFKQAMRMLEGTWQVSVKSFGGAANAEANQMQGTSTRRWILNQNILEEEVRSSGSGANFQVREPGSPPSQTRPGGSMSQNFEGHGMFGFNSQNNEFQHVWCDSMDTKLSYSTGRYDERTRTFTFTKEGDGTGMPSRTTPSVTTPPRTTPPSTTPPTTTPPSRPGTTPPNNPGSTNPDDDLRSQASPSSPPSSPPTTTPPPSRPGSTPPSTPTTPSTPGMQRPGAASNNLDMSMVDRVVIRIQDENRHVVEYYSGGQNKLMEITYTKGTAGGIGR